MLEPMLIILAWPVGVFGWVLYDLHRNRAPAKEPAPVAVATEPVPGWQPSVSAPA